MTAAIGSSWKAPSPAITEPPIIGVAETNRRPEASAVEPSSGMGRGRPGDSPSDEALAVGAVLFRAHEAARHLERLLELEAPDPRVAELLRDAKRVRKSIAALLVDVAVAASALQVPT